MAWFLGQETNPATEGWALNAGHNSDKTRGLHQGRASGVKPGPKSKSADQMIYCSDHKQGEGQQQQQQQQTDY